MTHRIPLVEDHRDGVDLTLPAFRRSRLANEVLVAKDGVEVLRHVRSGANSYIVKPADFEQFPEPAQQIGMYWLMLNRNPPEVAP